MTDQTDTAEALFSRYEHLEPLGHRGCGELFRAVDSYLNKIVSVKLIHFHDKEHGFVSDVLREISLLMELRHVNIVRLIAVETVPGHRNGCRLIMECGQCNLASYIKAHIFEGINPEIAKNFLMQILKGLNYCHSKKFMHRDLNPRSILIADEGVIKLSDFGLSVACDTPCSKYSLKVGSLRYRAPELLLGLPLPYTNSIDIWAVGCIFVELVTRNPLFTGTSEATVMESIISIFGMPTEADLPGAAGYCRNKFAIQEPTIKSRRHLGRLVPSLPKEGLDLLEEMLCINPDKRISAANALLHPFFEEFGLKPKELLLQE
ncbi:cell division control protein 2 homolog A-like [Andrographis paniculata]|uniref:cell division control protein 2 homolog A-like n=1 Tax=Andrographis paniculata TaxID=175694 RepID=UPI0021E7D8FD|nr:cell division control protein 2 homolog A-like [Andrographis paniculata]XP_051147600.1 cell division control protein 2 homolog A-like [Andrographis paniculata]XP_051147604.1 cell division control protein 2 homolog A-like [Andrographis paniculata]